MCRARPSPEPRRAVPRARLAPPLTPRSFSRARYIIAPPSAAAQQRTDTHTPPHTISHTQEELAAGEDVAHCPSCSLVIHVIYNLADFANAGAAGGPGAGAAGAKAVSVA